MLVKTCVSKQKRIFLNEKFQIHPSRDKYNEPYLYTYHLWPTLTQDSANTALTFILF